VTVWRVENLGINEPKACVNGKWVPARPVNYKYRTLFERIREAWLVFTGKADCFIWPEGQ
jgi:hypothetical protein